MQMVALSCTCSLTMLPSQHDFEKIGEQQMVGRCGGGGGGGGTEEEGGEGWVSVLQERCHAMSGRAPPALVALLLQKARGGGEGGGGRVGRGDVGYHGASKSC